MLKRMAFKLPESVLVVVHTPLLDVLLLRRAAQPDFWQSVTGSREPGDPDPEATARREPRGLWRLDAYGVLSGARAGRPADRSVSV